MLVKTAIHLKMITQWRKIHILKTAPLRPLKYNVLKRNIRNGVIWFQCVKASENAEYNLWFCTLFRRVHFELHNKSFRKIQNNNAAFYSGIESIQENNSQKEVFISKE